MDFFKVYDFVRDSVYFRAFYYIYFQYHIVSLFVVNLRDDHIFPPGFNAIQDVTLCI